MGQGREAEPAPALMGESQDADHEFRDDGPPRDRQPGSPKIIPPRNRRCCSAWWRCKPPRAVTAKAEDHVTFGIDWRAEAEYGGYYQALATGIYARHGLDVTIREGGPQVNHMQLLMAGRLDFNLGGGRAIEFVQNNLPLCRGRSDLPEGSGGADRASWRGQRQLRRRSRANRS